MHREPLRAITGDEVRCYREDGIVLLRGLFDACWVEHLRPLVDQDMAAPGPLHLELEHSGAGPSGGRFFFDTFLWPRLPGFRRFVHESPAAAIVGALMGASKVNVFFDQLLIKEPGTAERTPWHHDLPYWPIEGEQVCTLWLALDRVSADSGAVEYVRGSHRWGERYNPPAFAGDDRYRTGLPKVPDFEARRAELDIVQFELEPGDCTVHHALLVHGAPGNARTDRRRRAYVTRWAGDGVVYAPRENIMPILEDPGIPAGAPIDSALWPVIWRAPERTGTP
jgi:ectoine hydroxylase-related dioxygenase (phytanoyl-CoA dioxygenase family)